VRCSIVQYSALYYKYTPFLSLYIYRSIFLPLSLSLFLSVRPLSLSPSLSDLNCLFCCTLLPPLYLTLRVASSHCLHLDPSSCVIFTCTFTFTLSVVFSATLFKRTLYSTYHLSFPSPSNMLILSCPTYPASLTSPPHTSPPYTTPHLTSPHLTFLSSPLLTYTAPTS
jgi:hypothetical protein